MKFNFFYSVLNLALLGVKRILLLWNKGSVYFPVNSFYGMTITTIPREDNIREAFPHSWVSFNNLFLKSILVSVHSLATLRALPDWSVRVTWCRTFDQKEIKITFTAWRKQYKYSMYQELAIPDKELYCLNLILSDGRLAYVMRPMWDWCWVMVNLLDTALTKAFSSWKFARETSFEASTTKARSKVTGQLLMITE